MNAAAAPSSLTAAAPVDKNWSRFVWVLVVALTCAGQFGLIFLLGTTRPIQQRAPRPVPPMTLVGDKNAALVELTDPTVFVLPSRHGFSGAARAMTPRSQFVAADWDEPFQWLPLSASNLGETFQHLMVSSAPPPVQLADKTEPRVTALVTAPLLTLPAQSAVRVEGNLSGRDLLTPLELPSWPSADLLKATEVQVIVDAAGRVVSATVLGSSDLAEADQRALELARSARFETADRSAPDLVWGRMVFAWHTIPLPTAGETAVPQPLP